MRRFIVLVLILSLVALSGCRRREEPREEKIKITVEREGPTKAVPLLSPGERKTSAYEHASLGKKLAQAGDYVGAEKAYQKALELNPRYAYAHNQLGYLYQVSYQDYEKAIHHYQKAIEYNPTKTAQISRFQLASCYEEAGQIDKAIDIWKEYLKIEPPDSQYAFQARQHLEALQSKR